MSALRTLLAVAAVLSASTSSWGQKNLSGAPEIALALDRLTTLGSVLMIAAHPDDENTAALAYWARGKHYETAYLSCTRGEGGQNLIGAEQGDLLGVIRTEELLAARRIDGAEQFFTRAVDFGFTKTPRETLEKWGHDEILSDIVWVIRQYRPDVVVLRFSGTPRDGHGQHQASAILGKEAYAAAADPKRFPNQLKYVQPWQAKRLMWNVFNFSAQDEKASQALPKVQFDSGRFDPLLGKSYSEIAGISRSQHRSQGMGAPEHRGPAENSFSTVAGETPQKTLFDGVDTTWARVPGGAPVGEILESAARKFSPTNPSATVPRLLAARPMVVGLANSGDPWAKRKLTELDEAVVLASGLWLEAEADKFAATPGGKFRVTLTAINRSEDLAVSSVSARIQGSGISQQAALTPGFPYNKPVTQAVEITLPFDAPISQPFWLKQPPQGSRYTIDDQRLIGRAAPVPAMNATFHVWLASGEIEVTRPVHFRYVDRVQGELTRPLAVIPPVTVNLPQNVFVFTRNEPRRVDFQLRANTGAAEGDVHVETSPGWRVEPAQQHFKLLSQGDQSQVTFTVTPLDFHAEKGGKPAGFKAFATVGDRRLASGVTFVEYPHIPPRAVFYPSAGSLREAPLTVLAHHVGYVMGAGDDVPQALKQMDCDVTQLSESDLTSGDLSRFDAIVTGVRAYNVRPDLRASQSRLLDYVQNGGTLLVQYNVAEDRRFSRGPDLGLDRLGPYPFTVGRDRVTVEEAPVEFLSAKNVLLTTPNVITSKDFEGWVQERGLYFASKWDPHYETVFSSHDPNEANLPGGTLFTRYGKGAYVFSSYSWFRQLPAGVPGAYRIFANLLSAGKAQ